MKGLIAAVLLVFSGASIASVLPDRPHVYVEGSASIEVVPDTMTFTVSIRNVAETVAEAKNDVDGRSRQLIEALKGIGVEDKYIAATMLSIRPATEYRSGTTVEVGVRVSRQIEVTITELELYPEIMNALVEAEISETVDTRLSVSNEKELTDQALVAAMQDAKERAERLAATQGRELGEVYSISEFMTRQDHRYLLQVSRRIEGQASDVAYAMVRSRVPEPFDVGVMAAKAEVYVVYLLN